MKMVSLYIKFDYIKNCFLLIYKGLKKAIIRRSWPDTIATCNHAWLPYLSTCSHGLLLKYTELLVLKCVWISLKFIAIFFLHEPESVPINFFIVHLLQEFGHVKDFGQRQEKEVNLNKNRIFLVKCLMINQMINFIITLVKKYISSFSRKKSWIAFIDIVTYLQTFTNILLIHEKKMFDTDVYLKRWSDWKLPFEWSLFMLHNGE